MRFSSMVLLTTSLLLVPSVFAGTNQWNSFEKEFKRTQPMVVGDLKHHTRLAVKKNSRKYYGQGKYKTRQKVQRGVGFAQKRPATGRRVFIFSPRSAAWAVYDEGGNLIRTGRASGGKGYCPDVRRACRTPQGVFRVYSKGGPGCKSRKYPVGRGGAPMPHCMFFYKGYGIHGSPHVPGYNASHGCIRVLPEAARWLSHNFINHGTTVIVTSY